LKLVGARTTIYILDIGRDTSVHTKLYAPVYMYMRETQNSGRAEKKAISSYHSTRLVSPGRRKACDRERPSKPNETACYSTLNRELEVMLALCRLGASSRYVNLTKTVLTGPLSSNTIDH